MNLLLKAAVLALLAPSVAWSQSAASPPSLLSHLTGKWVLEGEIAGKHVTHDVAADLVLGHYVQLREVAREKDANGRPAYEAIVFLEWQADVGRYACLWLDSTGGGGLSAGTIGHAKPDGDEIPLLFEGTDGSRIHNTFAYDRVHDSWQWRIDNEREGQRQPFARVALRRE
jgi:hypothetical protein